MDINLLILGALLILVIFGVGESVYKKLKLNRLFLIIVLTLLVLGLYVPNLKIKEVSISLTGFLLPTLLAIIFSFKIRSPKVVVNFLLTAFVFLALRTIYFDLQFVPLSVCLVSMISLGIACGLLSKEIFSLVCGNIFGFVVGNVIYDLIKFNSLSTGLAFNGIYFVLVSLIVAAIILFAKDAYKHKNTKNRVTTSSLQNGV